MLTLEQIDNAADISVSTFEQPVENLLTKEWLLTNERGSYASSTILGCNTRAYHGLLIGSLQPPANRVMALSNCLEMVISKEEVFNLSTFEFSDKFAPTGFSFLKQFRRDIGVHFDYELEKVQLTKSVYLLRDTDIAAIEYNFSTVPEPVDFVSRPFVGLRDFHTLQKSYAPLCSKAFGDGILVHHNTPQSCGLFLRCPSTSFEKDRQWWFNFVYRTDRERGQNFTEDLWTPGFFKCRVDSPTRIVLWAELRDNIRRNSDIPESQNYTTKTIDTVREDLLRHEKMIAAKRSSCNVNRSSKYKSKIQSHEQCRTLYSAADQFIAKRSSGHKSNPNNHEQQTTILAGYPWFMDWGRDTFISLPGLLLWAGRFDEAKSVLTTFAAAADEGMIPNRFDDRSDEIHFNSVDASLWFINAAFQYLRAGGDAKAFIHELLPKIKSIVKSYNEGTRFNIHADGDGLIIAGNDQTQLTWMDAKYDGVAFTPRYGKAVEVNALWYNCLCLLAQFYAEGQTEDAEHYRSMADKVRLGFCELFWNQDKGYLNDCILPDGSVDDSLRPNQIFAVSLGFSPLQDHQQKSVVDVVQNHLLTPYGLRTLSPVSARYKGRYTGSPRERDEAYHQGTVWPYLIGPFIEAYLKVNKFSPQSKKQASEFIQPLLQHLTEDGCIGSISEIFDGDFPHNPKGCIAQAWSVAELIRAYQLING